MSRMQKRSSQRTESLLQTVKIPDIFSLFNAAAGLASIFFSSVGRLKLAAVFLIIAVIFDYLDGKMARLLEIKREFGRQMDSLCDIVSFGVAPVVFGLQIVDGTAWNYLILIAFVLCGILRLARFNALGDMPYYVGVPITTWGYVIPLFFFAKLPSAYFPWLYLLMAVLMVSPIKIPKLSR